MSIRKTLLASATLALVMIAGAATVSAAPLHSASHPMLHSGAALTIQYRAPNPRDFRGDRWDRRPIVSDRMILATLRAHNYRAISNPRLVRDRIVVRAVGRFGRVVIATFNPYTGRMIGVTRI